MSKSTQTTTVEPQKTDLFDRLADALGFETTDGDRKPRFRYHELTIVYDRLFDLDYIPTPRTGEEVCDDLRDAVANALGIDSNGGRPRTKGELRLLVGILCDDDVVADGGSATGRQTRPADEGYPTERDLVQARKQGIVQEWDDPEDCVCISKRQNYTTYHTYWTVRDGDLIPACRGYAPSRNTPHRLVPEVSITRTKDECDYCKNEDLRL